MFMSKNKQHITLKFTEMSHKMSKLIVQCKNYGLQTWCCRIQMTFLSSPAHEPKLLDLQFHCLHIPYSPKKKVNIQRIIHIHICL